jgi:hypothetical protein
LATPEEYLGRVSALASVLFRSTMPIGALLAGMLSQMMTLRQVMLLGTAGLALSAFILTVSRSGQPDTISAST